MDIPEITAAIRRVAEARGAGKAGALHEPWLDDGAWTTVKECLDSGWVSSAGPFVDQFERELAETTGARHLVATASGTAALHLCLIAAGVRGGDEVIMPSLTFVATANAATYAGAVPHFADVARDSLGLDPEKLSGHLDRIAERRDGITVNKQTGRPIRAVVCMHTFGHPVDLDPLVALTERWNLTLIEDAAEALGSLYKGRHVGSHGRMAALSFNGNKIVTSGGGGAVMTNDKDMAAKIRHLSTTAKKPHAWAFDHDQVGYNYRLPGINAALGLSQLSRLGAFLRAKRRLTEDYRSALNSIPGVAMFEAAPWCSPNNWLSVLMLDRPNITARDQLLEAMQESGLGGRPLWTPMHLLPMYETSPAMDLSVTEEMNKRIVCLPSSAFLSEQILAQDEDEKGAAAQ